MSGTTCARYNRIHNYNKGSSRYVEVLMITKKSSLTILHDLSTSYYGAVSSTPFMSLLGSGLRPTHSRCLVRSTHQAVWRH
jgi:hypothetical protein